MIGQTKLLYLTWTNSKNKILGENPILREKIFTGQTGIATALSQDRCH